MGPIPAPGEPFEGSLQLMEWAKLPWSERQVIGLYGLITVRSTEDALGFSMGGGGHANWLALVRGEMHTYIVPGCQVRHLVAGLPPEEMRNADYTKVP